MRARIRMPAARKRHQAFVDFMIPIVKGCSTETAQEVASLGIQVHGGMGFIEETGAAQHYRDARIIDDLRRHDRHPGERPHRPQDGARRRRGGAARSPARSTRSRRSLSRHADANLKAIGARLAEARRGRAQRRRLDGARVRREPARRARGRGALSRAVGPRRRRLADGARGAGRGEASRTTAPATRAS